MIGLIVALASVGAYLCGWMTFTVPAARFIESRRSSCHVELKPGKRDRFSIDPHYQWSTQDNCSSYHVATCWRPNASVSIQSVVEASFYGLLWPLVAFPAAVYWMANRRPHPVAANFRRIAELERELGIGEDA